jgi:hypothetical protein
MMPVLLEEGWTTGTNLARQRARAVSRLTAHGRYQYGTMSTTGFTCR